jgi:phenylacetate-CoA ligase
MSRVRGRIDDLIIMGASKVFPSQIEQIILGVEGLQPHYEIIVDREAGIDTMEVRVEISEAMPGMDEMKTLERAKDRLAKGIDAAVGVKAKVTLVEPRKIARQTEGKQRRVVDRRRM